MSNKERLKIIITQSALNVIEKYKQSTKNANESGGILLGQIKENAVYILRVTIPNKFDKASRYSFDCNKDAAQVVIDYEFINSGKKTIYLGEWHTHPENYPSPSGVDKKMIKKQYFKNKLNEPFLILLIQGLNGLYVAIFDGEKLEEIKITILDYK
jgi:integrative and conjugative element protein (TIGR02256 family)